jgi:hypothetical protein
LKSLQKQKSVLYTFLKFLFLGLILSTSVLGCGKYSPVVPPERLAPKAVIISKTNPTERGITLEWQSPEEQVRNKELKELDGYYVYRKELPRFRSKNFAEEGEASEIQYEQIAFVKDDSLKLIENRRTELRGKSLPGRQASLSDAEKSVIFTDEPLIKGKLYLYKVEPYSWGGRLGPVKQYVQILFDGLASKVDILAAEEQAGSIVSAPPIISEEPIIEEESSSSLLGN